MDRDFLFAVARDEHRQEPISKADVLAGIHSDDVELAGAIYDIVTTDDLKKRIEPPLADDELDGLLTGYFERCIVTNPKGKWTLTRYGAAWEVRDWMLGIWEAEHGSSESFLKWKKWIEGLYRAGNEGIKRAIVDGILEHLFERKALRQSFSDWRSDPELKTAYEEAQLWADTQLRSAEPGSA